jgi:long-chain acyl-CoA synthetase
MTQRAPVTGRLDLTALLNDRQLMVIGGTGFLGKVWVSLLLARYPSVKRLYLVVRRKGTDSAGQRFWQETLHSPVWDPLREQHGEGFERFMRDKIVPIEGDIVRAHCGVDASLRDELRGRVAAVVNASGIVDFEPPLDVALEVNAFGVQNLVELAHSLGDCPLLHTSTSFVAGNRTGFVEEEDPLLHPFPRAGELERAHWDPRREIDECLSIIEQAKERANDAFRQSHFLNEARASLLSRHEPATGTTLEQEVEHVKRKYIEARLAEMGNERARFWGWPNTYTYTKSIGEQIAVASGLQVTIVRPAIVETSVAFPMVGWNEGINTSAPLIYAIREGQTQLPGSAHNLDMIPVDMVAGGMLMALGELLDGTAPAVYQLGASDCNPVTMARIFELTGLYKRQYHLARTKSSPLSTLQAHVEGALFTSERFEKYGPKAVARAARGVADLLRRRSADPTFNALSQGALQGIEQFAKGQERIARLLWQFSPFTADYDYTFRCDHVRAARARLSGEERAALNWEPEAIDWRQWFLHVHTPALERWVFPEIEKRRRRPPRALRAHESLTAMLEEMSRRHDLEVALQDVESEGLSRISYRDLRAHSLACAQRLRDRGIVAGDRVLLVSDNQSAWVMACFGALYAGATLVPLANTCDAAEFAAVARACGAKLCIAEASTAVRVRSSVSMAWLDLEEATRPGAWPAWANVEPRNVSTTLPPVAINRSEDTALLVFRGAAAPLSFSHGTLCATLATLAAKFPLGPSDRLLSQLPLSDPFELCCGLLLPLSRGARVAYFDAATQQLEAALRAVHPTALVGNPQVWQELEHRLRTHAQRGPIAAATFEALLDVGRRMSRSGVNLGRLLFGSVHRVLGGELQLLINGDGALPDSTYRALTAVGLRVSNAAGPLPDEPVSDDPFLAGHELRQRSSKSFEIN